jgi:hypothetical protein
MKLCHLSSEIKAFRCRADDGSEMNPQHPHAGAFGNQGGGVRA